MAKKNWSREEHILAFNLYCKVPFTKINSKNKNIQELASIIGRSSGSVAMKLANFARLDPDLQARNISGLTQGAKGEEDIWQEFKGNWNELSFESERILLVFKNTSIKQSLSILSDEILPDGTDQLSLVKSRVNQSFFRNAVLASYNCKCCITGIAIPDLLVASHIIPWSLDISNRTNPANGLCLNALHDKAFDRGLITITPDYFIRFSENLLRGIQGSNSISLMQYNNQRISLPQKFYPHREFLEYHNSKIFQG